MRAEIVALALFAAPLAACTIYKAPPEISYDDEKPAVLQAEPPKPTPTEGAQAVPKAPEEAPGPLDKATAESGLEPGLKELVRAELATFLEGRIAPAARIVFSAPLRHFGKTQLVCVVHIAR